MSMQIPTAGIDHTVIQAEFPLLLLRSFIYASNVWYLERVFDAVSRLAYPHRLQHTRVPQLPQYQRVVKAQRKLRDKNTEEVKQKETRVYLVFLIKLSLQTQTVPFQRWSGCILQSRALTGPGSPLVCSATPAQQHTVNMSNCSLTTLFELYHQSGSAFPP